MAAPTIGQLRSRLTFEKDVLTSDGSGGYTSVKSTDFLLWGAIRKVSDYDQTRAGQEVGYDAIEIWVLYQADKYPNKQHVILSGNYIYTASSVREINDAHRWVVITATASLVATTPALPSINTADSIVITADSIAITADSI